jgi:hypothetical protein
MEPDTPRNENLAPGPAIDRPTHSPDGVDLTLIRWTLSLTPAERLRALQQAVRSLLRLRDGRIVP